jgi:riboflavin synthase
MFSGIVQKMGTIVEYDLAEKWGRIGLRIEDWEEPVREGESICTQGICLTIAAREGDVIYFDVLRQTFEVTNLGTKQEGGKLNLERSLRWGEPMGGHIVIGHVDGIGRVEQVDRVGRDWSYRISCGPEILDYLVNKGSVSLDGVSLTLADLYEDGFRVHIIPYTYEETTFHELQPGSLVNLEADLLAKYVHRLMERGRIYPEVTWEKLRETGLIQELPEA